jgi:hypothetical protein
MRIPFFLSVSVSPRPQGCALHFKQFSYRRKAVVGNSGAGALGFRD